MVANNDLRCAVVYLPAEFYRTREQEAATEHQSDLRKLGDARKSSDARKPSDLVPWADPYIAALVRKLQDEVRTEARDRRLAERLAAPVAELEAPYEPQEWEDNDTWWDDAETGNPVGVLRELAVLV